MAREVHSEGLRERQNMREAARTRKNGNWCIVGFSDEWPDTDERFGLQGWRYESKEAAQEFADELDEAEEYQHVDEHRVMKHEEYEELCDEHGVDRDFPW